MADACARKQLSPHTGWCSTLNNYTNEELQALLAWCRDRSGERKFWYVVGEEVGASGTPHLQCAFFDEKRWRFPTAKNKCNSPEKREVNTLFQMFRHKFHNEAMRGAPQQAFEYCMKDGKYHTNCKVENRRYVSCAELDRLWYEHREFLHAERVKAHAWFDFINDVWFSTKNYDMNLGYIVPDDTYRAINETFAWCGDQMTCVTVRRLTVMS